MLPRAVTKQQHSRMNNQEVNPGVAIDAEPSTMRGPLGHLIERERTQRGIPIEMVANMLSLALESYRQWVASGQLSNAVIVTLDSVTHVEGHRITPCEDMAAVAEAIAQRITPCNDGMALSCEEPHPVDGVCAPTLLADIGRVIRNHRRRCGLEIYELAATMMVGSMTVAQWEIGQQVPSLRQMQLLALLLSAPRGEGA